MAAQTPRQLPPAVARLLPLRPEIQVSCVTGLQTVRQDLEGGAATTSLLHVAVGDLTGQLVEVERQVVRAKGCHTHIDTTPVLPRGQTPALQHPAPALPHPVANLLREP